MSPDPEKVKTIQDWPVPKGKAAVKFFLQTCQFSQEFMRPGQRRTYSDVTPTLRRLTAMNEVQVVSRVSGVVPGVEEAHLRQHCGSALGPKQEDEAVCGVDRGPEGLGGTVAQNHGKPGEKSCWRPVHYSNRALTKAEANYGKVEGVSLGVASMIQVNKMYLYGTEFEVLTNYQPLCALYNSSHRNLSKLRGFKLVYEPGSTTPSDYASRHPAKAKNYSKEE